MAPSPKAVSFVLGVGATLSVIAAAMAFLVAYDEALHRIARRRARREGIRAAMVGFSFFAVLSVGLALVLA